MDLLPKFRIGFPLFDDIRTERYFIRFSAQIQLRTICGSFFVIFVLDRPNRNDILVPVVFIHFKHALIFRLERLQDVRTAVKHRIIAGAELVPTFCKKIRLCRIPNVVGHHFQEIRHRLQQCIFHRIVIQSLDSHGGKVCSFSIEICLCTYDIVIPCVCNL